CLCKQMKSKQSRTILGNLFARTLYKCVCVQSQCTRRFVQQAIFVKASQTGGHKATLSWQNSRGENIKERAVSMYSHLQLAVWWAMWPMQRGQRVHCHRFNGTIWRNRRETPWRGNCSLIWSIFL